MILRPAQLSDAAALAELGRDAFVAKFGQLYSADNLARFLAESHSPAKLAEEIADPGMAIQIAERNGALLGMCKLKLASSLQEHNALEGAGLHNSHRTAVRPLEIKQLYTAPGLTGQGIGAALMDWAMAFARTCGADEVQLSVWSENHDAQRFYARYGFEKIADIAFWVGDHRDDEFLFARRL